VSGESEPNIKVGAVKPNNEKKMLKSFVENWVCHYERHLTVYITILIRNI